jgi:hypothetical protein
LKPAFVLIRLVAPVEQVGPPNASTRTITAITTSDAIPWMKPKLGASLDTNHPVTVPETMSSPRTIKLTTLASDELEQAVPPDDRRRAKTPNTPSPARPPRKINPIEIAIVVKS